MYKWGVTSATWLSAVIRCWTVWPSNVVICWMYELSPWFMHINSQFIHKIKTPNSYKNWCETINSLYMITWSDSSCSWVTKMWSCPRVCSLSGLITVWCVCKANEQKSHKDTSILFSICGFCSTLKPILNHNTWHRSRSVFKVQITCLTLQGG